MKKSSSFWSGNFAFVLLNGILALILVGALVWGLIHSMRGYTHHGEEVNVPEVKGLYREVAEATLQAEGLRLVVIDSTYSSKVPLGTIVDQNPPAASHAKSGRAVYVIINASQHRSTPLPDLRDLSVRQALAALASMHVVVSDTLYEPSEYRDLVLDVRRDGESLAPGTRLEEGSRVELIVGYGKGTEEVAVPELAGLDLEQARAVLLSSMLTLGVAEYDVEPTDETRDQYRVYRQDPIPDMPLLQGSRVDVYLSVDPEKARMESDALAPNDDEDFF